MRSLKTTRPATPAASVPENRIATTIRLPRALLEQLRAKAAADRRTATTLVEMALERLFEAEPPPESNSPARKTAKR
jgi:hypothetical protein